MTNQDIIEDLKKKVVKKLNWGDPALWGNNDFIRLHEILFEETSFNISIQTLKRLLGKVKTERNYSPHPATKDALSIYLGYNNWNHFLSESSYNYKKEKKRHFPFGTIKHGKKIIIGLLLLCLGLLFYYLFSYTPLLTKMPNNNLDIEIETGEKNYPSQIMHFSYKNFPSLKDTFFFIFDDDNYPQQYPITSKNGLFTHKYDFPYFYKPYLLYKDKIIKEYSFLIPSKGWFALLKQQNKKAKISDHSDFISNSQAHFSKEKVAKHSIDTNSLYFSHFILSKEFNISADSMTLKTRIKNTPENGGHAEGDIIIGFVTTTGFHMLHFTNPCCYTYTKQKISDIIISGKEHDNSAFSANFFKWTDIKIVFHKSVMHIYINKYRTKSIKYNEPLKELKVLHFSTKKSGTIDYIKILNSYTQDSIFKDDFQLNDSETKVYNREVK